MRPLFITTLALALSACVTGPKPLQGEYSNISPLQAAERNAVNAKIRWAGQIVAINNQAQKSCFEIVANANNSSGRPMRSDRSLGRFVACRTGFYDPAVFKAGREITITGAIDQFEMRKIGEYDYRYPMVSADVLYLWPEKRERTVIIERPYFGW